LAALPIIISRPSIAYVRSQLDTGDSARMKRALQYICRLYRNGHRVAQGDLVGLEQSIVGILYTRKNDEKVRRWALNALARCGTPSISLECVIDIFRGFSHEPQTAAAAVAALYRMQPDPTKFIDTLDVFDPQMRVLAALQHVSHTKLDLAGLPVNVETASPDVLKLGLIVVGLNRAPINLFHPRHSNAEIVRALGSHDDSIIAQYTVWAVAENDDLSIKDLGIPISSVESLPPNVRGWMYRVIALSAAIAAKNQDYIAQGAGDPMPEVRLGLAIGLLDTYYDGLEAVVLDWAINESDTEVSSSIIDHMVRHAVQCSNYEQMVIELYEKENKGSLLRQRMEAHAAKTPLYGRFQRISYDGSSDLFSGVTNVTINITGGINAGAVAIGGDASNSGTVNVHYQPQTIEAIQKELSRAIGDIHNSQIDAGLKEEALEHVKAAQADPTPDKLKKAVDLLGKVESGLKKLDGASQKVIAIGTTIANLAKSAGLM
jgi:hypothetical protein